jgi:hypothetical protein
MTSSASKQSVWPIHIIEWRHVDDVFCLTRRQSAVENYFRSTVVFILRSELRRNGRLEIDGGSPEGTSSRFGAWVRRQVGSGASTRRTWSGTVLENFDRSFDGKDIRQDSDVSQRTKDSTAAYIGDAFLRCRVLERRSRELTFQGSRLITGKPDPFRLNLWVRTSWLIDRTTVWLNPFYL